jgi:hypothetical protein
MLSFLARAYHLPAHKSLSAADASGSKGFLQLVMAAGMLISRTIQTTTALIRKHDDLIKLQLTSCLCAALVLHVKCSVYAVGRQASESKCLGRQGLHSPAAAAAAAAAAVGQLAQCRLHAGYAHVDLTVKGVPGSDTSVRNSRGTRCKAVH